MTKFTKLRVVFYGRISTTSRADEFLDRQTAEIQAALDRANCEIVGTYRDTVTGGHGEQPPGIESLLSDLSDGRTPVDAIAVTSRDRLSRHANADVFAQLDEFGFDVIETDNVMPQAG